MTLRVERVEANGHPFEVHTCGDGERLALLLHGFPEHAISWRHQMPVLAELGFTVWAPNLRGYGESFRPTRVRDYTVQHLVEDVGGLIDAAGKRSTLLVGHDWGGAIAWLTALMQIRPLAGLVVMNLPHIKLYQQAMLRFPPAQLWRARYMLPFLLPYLGPWLYARKRGKKTAAFIRNSSTDPLPDSILDVYRNQAATPGQMRAMMMYYRANLGAMLGRMPAHQQQAVERVLETPTLLLWGTQDPFLARNLNDGTEQLVRDLTVHYLDDSSHWLQQEQPDKVNEILRGWIEQLPGSLDVP
ncbi:MAG: alpha/beta fold hydrolase [Nannocystaceae bacterium]